MVHTMKYSIRIVIRNKAQCFWLILFPIILGTLFKLAFSNLGVTTEAIPVAVVTGEDADTPQTENFRTTVEKLGQEGEEGLLEVTYCDRKQALQLLEEGEVDGIFTVGEKVSLSVSARDYSDQRILNQNILHTFVERYNLSAAAMTDIAADHPERLPDAVRALEEEHFYNKEISLSASEDNTYLTYFYNLLAMSCMFCSMSGVYVSLNHQGNLSALGARRNISPTPKLTSVIGELAAYVLVNYGCILIGFAYLNLVLRVDLSDRLPLTLLTLFVSDMAGSAFGFFVGAIGRMSEGIKSGVTVAVSMLCCFLSGLMVSNMRILIEKSCPFVNRINPAALISDSFYCLAHFDDYARYTRNMVSLGVFTILFLAGGFLLTRRRRYASL